MERLKKWGHCWVLQLRVWWVSRRLVEGQRHLSWEQLGWKLNGLVLDVMKVQDLMKELDWNQKEQDVWFEVWKKCFEWEQFVWGRDHEEKVRKGER